jgi:hypothetical protein
MLQSQADFQLHCRRMGEFETLLQKLRQARERLLGNLHSIERAISSLESAMQALPPEVLDSTLRPLLADTEYAMAPQTPEPQRVRGVLSPHEVASAASEALLAVGRPLKRGQLVRELEKRNIPLAGKDKNKNLGTILWRHEHMFVSLPGLGYWPRGAPLPGVYEPEGQTG